jgi:predicted nucleotidyltransferase
MSALKHGRAVNVSVAKRIAGQFASLHKVEAIAISGSQASELHDSNSDVDLYVYVTEAVPLEVRRRIASGAERAEVGNEYWEPG